MGTVLDPAITIPDTYADRLLRQAEYHILGPEGAFRSGRSVDIFNLAPTRWGKWGKSVIKGTKPTSVWTPGEIGHGVVQLDGVDQYVELPHDLMSNRPEGTTMMVVRGPAPTSSVPYSFLSDEQVGDSLANITQDPSLLGPNLAFDIFVNEDQDTEALVGGPFIPDRWVLVGYEWGPAGQRTYLNGALNDKEEGHTQGTWDNSNSGTLAIGKFQHPNDPRQTVFSPISVAFFAFWSRQLGEAAHRAIKMAERPGIS